MAQALDWETPFKTVTSGQFGDGTTKWFEEGRLNVCYNCVDRYAASQPETVAIRWDADEPHQSKDVTYAALLDQVSRCSMALKSFGVQKGDRTLLFSFS